MKIFLNYLERFLRTLFFHLQDPSTLNMFLKEYLMNFIILILKNSGDAFEYLLSFMGSQGDAGQY